MDSPLEYDFALMIDVLLGNMCQISILCYTIFILMFMSKMFIYECEVNGQTWIYFKYLIVQLLYEWYYAEENLKVVLE